VNFREGFTPASARDEYGIAWLLPESTFLEGDANLDGWVGLDDFATWKSGVGHGNLLSEGDFDLDGDVDLVDAELLKANFGNYQQLAAVPEPLLWQYLISLVIFAGPFTFARQRLVRVPSCKPATS